MGSVRRIFEWHYCWSRLISAKNVRLIRYMTIINIWHCEWRTCDWLNDWRHVFNSFFFVFKILLLGGNFASDKCSEARFVWKVMTSTRTLCMVLFWMRKIYKTIGVYIFVMSTAEGKIMGWILKMFLIGWSAEFKTVQ